MGIVVVVVVVGIVEVVVVVGFVVVVVVVGFVVVVVVVVLVVVVGGEAVAGLATRRSPTKHETSTVESSDIRRITESNDRFTTSIYLVLFASSRKALLRGDPPKGDLRATVPYSRRRGERPSSHDAAPGKM
ncbi:MAG TPA: hypothetical protein VMV11_06070 [Acidimicrobiales bacterium]|nr:hypothetical protein [Acidimicrobiales bacterium]